MTTVRYRRCGILYYHFVEVSRSTRELMLLIPSFFVHNSCTIDLLLNFKGKLRILRIKPGFKNKDILSQTHISRGQTVHVRIAHFQILILSLIDK